MKEYVVWRDHQVRPSREEGAPGRGRKGVNEHKPVLPQSDPGKVIIHKWRKRLTRNAYDDGGSKATTGISEEKSNEKR
jgi:hypothetical protein